MHRLITSNYKGDSIHFNSNFEESKLGWYTFEDNQKIRGSRWASSKPYEPYRSLFAVFDFRLYAHDGMMPHVHILNHRIEELHMLHCAGLGLSDTSP